MEERKEEIRKEMNKIMFEMQMTKFNEEKFAQLKEVHNQLKKEYKQILFEEKTSSKKCK